MEDKTSSKNEINRERGGIVTYSILLWKRRNENTPVSLKKTIT